MAMDGQRFVDQQPHDPASEISFILKAGRISRCVNPAVLHRSLGSPGVLQYPAGREPKHRVRAGEPIQELFLLG
jgi:hypothetical protein